MVVNKSYEKPLFPDQIEAWQYGPVIPSIYKKYKKHGFEIIKPTSRKPILSLAEMKSIDMVLEYYGNMTGVELIAKTHSEKPWASVYAPYKKHIPISNESIFNYFNSVLEFDND